MTQGTRSDALPSRPGPSGHPILLGAADGGGELGLSRASLRGQARRVIRASIVTGRLAAGQIYTVSQLTKQLNVSITPIREALMDLASEDLVEIIPNRGFRIPQLTEEDLDQLIELRVLLEVPTVQQVSRTNPPASTEKLKSLAMDAIKSAASGDHTEYLDLDREFHLQLLAAGGNSRLVALVGRMRDQTRLVALTEPGNRAQLMASANEHLQILDAVSRGDAATAGALMMKHLDDARGIWSGRRKGARSPAPAAVP